MTSYVHDGTTFDLDRAYMDVIGIEWTWTGEWTATGEPLMRGGAQRTPVPLPDVYHDHGPLIPVAAKPSASVYRAAVDPDFAASMAAGFVESLTAYEDRVGGTP